MGADMGFVSFDQVNMVDVPATSQAPDERHRQKIAVSGGQLRRSEWRRRRGL